MQEFQSYMDSCDKEIGTAINDYRNLIRTLKDTKIMRIKDEVESEDLETLRSKIISWRVERETGDYDTFIKRIDKFRL